MTTAKEALLAAGRIDKIGRGRISLDNHAWLKEQYDAGTRFSDWPKGKVVSVEPRKPTVEGKAVEPAKVRVVRDPNQSNEKVVREFSVLYDERDYHAVSSEGKSYTMREVCNTCMVSLVQNVCANPTILGNIPVTIKAKARA